MSLVAAVVVVFGVLAPPERCPEVTAEELRQSSTQTVEWFERNQLPDGRWLYQYDAETDEAAPDYNVVRHAGVTMGLYQAAAAGIPGALESADRGLDWAERHLIDDDGQIAITYRGQTPVGAAALLAAGLVDRRATTGDDEHDDLLRGLGRFLEQQTEPSGAVLAQFDEDAGAPIAGVYSKYYTGEAYWALARLHRVFPDEGWGQVADRIGAYMATSRDEVEDYWPPIPDHWAAYALSETVAFDERAGNAPLTDDERDYARSQAELFGAQVRWVSQRFGPWGSLVRGSYVPRGGGYGVVGEALTGLWLVADRDAGLADLRAPIAERATCIAGLAIETQSDEDEASEFADPEAVQGAWFRDGGTRMDDQQHALAALLRTIPITESAARNDDGATTAPSPWLLAVALVAAMNPCRAAFGVPRRDASRRDVAGLAALGGVIGAVLAAVIAAFGDRILDALEVSNPAARIAAGIVAGVAGIAALLRRPPSSDPALPGWRAALVPVAVPLVARPALLVLALSAGADRGAGLVLGALAAGVAALAVLAAFVPVEGTGGRVLSWAARLLAAVLVAASVLLVIDGVYDV